MISPRFTRIKYLILQAFLFCGLGCLLIGSGLAFPFSYYRYIDLGRYPDRVYKVEQFSGQVSNTKPFEHYDNDYWRYLETVELRDFYTNGSSVNLHIVCEGGLILSYHNFSNTSENPLNLFFNETIPLYIQVVWNNTTASFSSWIFLLIIYPPPVVSIALDYTPIIVTCSLLIFGFLLLIIGSWRWLQIPLTGEKTK